MKFIKKISKRLKRRFYRKLLIRSYFAHLKHPSGSPISAIDLAKGDIGVIQELFGDTDLQK